MCIIFHYENLYHFFMWAVKYVHNLYTTKFDNNKFYALPTQCIYVCCVDLSTNSHYFPIQH